MNKKKSTNFHINIQYEDNFVAIYKWAIIFMYLKIIGIKEKKFKYP